MKFSIYYYLVFALLISPSCQKSSNQDGENGEINLYLLKSYQTLENSCQIDEQSVTTNQNPLIVYADILLYNSTEYAFTFSDNAISILSDIQFPVNGMAFGLKANEELIYTGYFWPSYSSASCDWIIMDPSFIFQKNTIRVRLGYPGLIEGDSIPDKRNDSRLLNILAADGKLVQ